MQHRECHPIRMCIGDGCRVGRAPAKVAKEHAFPKTLRRLPTNEQTAFARHDWCGDRHSRSIEVCQETRFGLDVSGSARATMRKTKDVALAVRCDE